MNQFIEMPEKFDDINNAFERLVCSNCDIYFINRPPMDKMCFAPKNNTVLPLCARNPATNLSPLQHYDNGYRFSISGTPDLPISINDFFQQGILDAKKHREYAQKAISPKPGEP